MKIVHVITGLSTGGAETTLASLLPRMDLSSFESNVVLLTGPGVLGPKIEAADIPVQALDLSPRPTAVRGFWRLYRWLRHERPDIVQTWMYHADLIGSIAAWSAGIRCVAWNLRCSDMDLRKYRPTTRLVVRTLASMSRLPRVVIANSEAGRSWHEALGYQPRRWAFIPNGIDTEVYRPDPQARAAARGALGFSEAVFAIGLIAHQDPMKDHATFIRAAARLATTRPEARFVLVGRGTDSRDGALDRLIAEAGITDRMRRLGERTDVAKIVPGLDLVVLSSASGEGFPNALGEAMACGVPCVATDVGDAARVIGETGLVVRPRDPDALAAAWDEAAARDDATRMALGAAARERIIAQYSLAEMVRRYEDLYSELLPG